MGIEDNKERILKLLYDTNREGMNYLVEYMDETRFFTTKCSRKHHLAVRGGLATHSLHVYDNFSHKNDKWNLNIPKDSVVIMSILHDICKLEDNEDKSKHGSRSIEILGRFIELTLEEKMVIKYHMGLFSVFGYEEFTAHEIHQAISIHPSVQIFASSDMECSVYEDGGKVPEQFKEIETDVKSALAEIQEELLGG